MTAWADKNRQVVSAQQQVYRVLQGLHPIDKAEAYKEVGRACDTEGDRLQVRNADLGVPEREGPQGDHR